jgi:hypothetical protein
MLHSICLFTDLSFCFTSIPLGMLLIHLVDFDDGYCNVTKYKLEMWCTQGACFFLGSNHSCVCVCVSCFNTKNSVQVWSTPIQPNQPNRK